MSYIDHKLQMSSATYSFADILLIRRKLLKTSAEMKRFERRRIGS